MSWYVHIYVWKIKRVTFCAALAILMPRHAEYSYRQKKVTAQSPAECLQSLMPSSWLSLRLICKISVSQCCHLCQQQTCSSFPFRDVPWSCWGDFCGKGASWTPHNRFLGASEYFPDKTAVRSVWMCSSLWRISNEMATLCLFETPCYHVWCTVQPKEVLLGFS